MGFCFVVVATWTGCMMHDCAMAKILYSARIWIRINWAANENIFIENKNIFMWLDVCTFEFGDIRWLYLHLNVSCKCKCIIYTSTHVYHAWAWAWAMCINKCLQIDAYLDDVNAVLSEDWKCANVMYCIYCSFIHFNLSVLCFKYL